MRTLKAIQPRSLILVHGISWLGLDLDRAVSVCGVGGCVGVLCL